MTKNSETVKEEDLIQRKDGLYYKKYAKVPFTGSMKIFRKVDPNGQSRVNSQTWKNINYKKGKPEGLYESFWLNGNLHFRGNTKKGKFEGLYESFWSNGNLHFRGNTKKGKFEGPCENFYSTGELNFKSYYRHSYHDGLFETNAYRGAYISLEKIEKKELVLKIGRDFKYMLSYLKNKKIPTTNCIGFYHLEFRRISVKDGVWEYFYDNGKLKTRIKFKNGKRVN